MDITRFPYDIQYLIWKLYFSNSVLTSLKNSRVYTKVFFKRNVLSELSLISVGVCVAKHINVYISNYPQDWFAIQFLDDIYYTVIEDYIYYDVEIFNETFCIDSYFYEY